MKAPDKIYIAETPNKLIEIWSEEPIEPKPYITEHEYIRKDALMELLLSLEARYSVFYLQGKVIRDVIDKIDSL